MHVWLLGEKKRKLALHSARVKCLKTFALCNLIEYRFIAGYPCSSRKDSKCKAVYFHDICRLSFVLQTKIKLFGKLRLYFIEGAVGLLGKPIQFPFAVCTPLQPFCFACCCEF